MTMQEFIYLLLIFCFGWFTVGLLVKSITLEEHAGLSLLLGFGVHSILYFIFILFFARLNINNIFFLIPEVYIVVFLAFITRRHTSHVHIDKDRKLRKIIDIVLVALSSLTLLYIFIQCVYWPTYEPDTLSFYDFRAQRLLVGDISTFFKGTSFYQNNLYPPFTSLMHFFLYQVGSVNPKIIYPLILFAFYLVIVGYVKRQTKSNLSGLLTGALILLTPSVMWNSVIAINNIIFMAYLSLACLYIFDNTEEKLANGGHALIGIILLSLSSWIRIEPFWVVPLALFGIKSLLRRNFLIIFVAFAVVLSVSQIWPEGLARYNINANPTGVQSSATNVVQQIKAAVEKNNKFGLANNLSVALHFLSPLYRAWGFILPFFIVVIVAEIVIFRKPPTSIEIVTLLLSLSVFFGIVDFSHRFPQWNGLNDSVFRMATITVPLYWVSIVTSKMWRKLF